MRDAKPSRVVAYIRVSTEEQGREGVSLAAQAESIRAYAKSQGWDLSNIYQDEYTGTTLDRPAFSLLTTSIKNGQIDMVLVYKLDRLARKQRLVLRILEDTFENNGVAFKSVTEPFDTSSAMGKAFVGMLAVFAQLERDTISERTRHALAHKKERGEYVGRIPFGFRMARNGRLEKDPDQQRAIAKIKRLRRNGKSLRTIGRAAGVALGTVATLVKSNGNRRNARYTAAG